MPACSVIQKFCLMNIFRILGSRSLSVTAMLNFSGKANTSIHDLGKDDMAMTVIKGSDSEIGQWWALLAMIASQGSTLTLARWPEASENH